MIKELADFECRGCTNNDMSMLSTYEHEKIYSVECMVCSLITYVRKEPNEKSNEVNAEGRF